MIRNLLTASRALLTDIDRHETFGHANASLALFRRAVEDAEKIDGERELLERVGNPSLTPTQLNMLKTIDRYWMTNNMAPTLQELADEIGISKVTVFEHANALEKKGCIRREKHMARSIRLIDHQPDQATELRRLMAQGK